MTDKIPDSSMAEKWLDPDTFVYKGKLYRFDWNNFTFKEVSPEPEGQAKKEGTQ